MIEKFSSVEAKEVISEKILTKIGARFGYRCEVVSFICCDHALLHKLLVFDINLASTKTLNLKIKSEKKTEKKQKKVKKPIKPN